MYMSVGMLSLYCTSFVVSLITIILNQMGVGLDYMFLFLHLHLASFFPHYIMDSSGLGGLWAVGGLGRECQGQQAISLTSWSQASHVHTLLLFVCGNTCVCMHISKHISIWWQVGTYMCGGHELISDIFCCLCLPYFWRQDPSPSQEIANASTLSGQWRILHSLSLPR